MGTSISDWHARRRWRNGGVSTLTREALGAVAVAGIGAAHPVPSALHCVRGFGELTRVRAEGLQLDGGEVLDRVVLWASQRTEQIGGDQHRDIVGLGVKVPSRLLGIEPGRQRGQGQQRSMFAFHGSSMASVLHQVLRRTTNPGCRVVLRNRVKSCGDSG